LLAGLSARRSPKASSQSYPWVLVRDKQIDASVLSDLPTKAKAWGFRTEDLIFVEQ